MNANIVLLGTSNSGKTNFISEAIKDINSFSPQITIIPVESAEITSAKLFRNGQYVLKVFEKTQWQFIICDYEGSLLKSHGDDNADLKSVLYSSDAWIILVDSMYFEEGENDERIIREIKRSTVRTILPYISDYTEKYTGKMPELLFVITKAKDLANKFSSDRIKNIILKSFEGIFTEESSPMILLSETSDTKSAGLAILSLFYIRYEKEINDGILRLKNRNKQIEVSIDNLKHYIYGIESQKIFSKLPGNKRKIENYNQKIALLWRESSENNNKIIQYVNDMGLIYLGTCVQCLIDNNSQLVINGFERINYQYDKTVSKMTECKRMLAVISFFNVSILIFFSAYLATKAGGANVLSRVIVLCIFAVLTYVVGNKKAKIILGIFAIFALVKLCALSGLNGWILAAGYTVWFVLSTVIFKAIGGWKDRHSGPKFKNSLVRFFYKRAKEKK